MSMPNNNSQKIIRLLDGAQHHDKDERFMAISDLTSELQSVEILDKTLQRPITDVIVLHLNDQSNDVQSIAVKCLSAIVGKFDADQVLAIAVKLAELVLVGKEELRDIYSIGIRAVINSAPDDMGQKLSSSLIPYFLYGLAADASQSLLLPPQPSAITTLDFPAPIDAQVICIDLLKDLVKRFGSRIAEFHGMIVDQVLRLLTSNCDFGVRRRVIAFSGSILCFASSEILEQFFRAIINQIEQPGPFTSLYFHIQTVGTICRSVGSRVTPWLNQIVPLLLKFSSTNHETTISTEASNTELQENCLQACEAILINCSMEVMPFFPNIVEACCRLARFDPNFVDDPMEREELRSSFDGNADGDEWDDAEDFDVQDAIDQTWKLRKDAISLIVAFVKHAPTGATNHYIHQFSNVLLNCFSDRNPLVRLQAFIAFTLILKSWSGLLDKSVIRSAIPYLLNALSQNEAEEMKEAVFLCLLDAVQLPEFYELSVFADYVSKLIQIASTSPISCSLLRFGIRCLQQIVQQSIDIVSENATFVQRIVSDNVQKIAGVAITGCNSGSPKTKAAALSLGACVSQCIKLQDADVLSEIFSTAAFQLESQDVDQVVKEAVLDTISIILAKFGSHFDTELITISFHTITLRLQNEVTRLASLRALKRVTSASCNLDMRPLLTESTLLLMLSLFRKTSPSLRYAAAETIDACIRHHSGLVSVQFARLCADEMINRFVDSDMHLAELCVKILSRLIVSFTPVLASDSLISPDLFFCNIPKLIQNALLPASCLLVLSELLQKLIFLSPSGGSFSKDSLLDLVFDQCNPECNRIAASNISKAVATIITTPAPDQENNQPIDKVVKSKLMVHLQQSSQMQLVALLAIGEVGRMADLSGLKDLPFMLIARFDDPSADCKWAASTSLGQVAIFSEASTLPIIMNHLEDSPIHRYLLLSSVKQVIMSRSSEWSMPSTLLPLLINYADSADEGVRVAVSQCLGSLCSIYQESHHSPLPNITEQLSSHSPNVRSVMFGSLRYMASSLELKDSLSSFLALLRDPDLSTRRHALLTVNALLRDPSPIPSLIESLDDLIPFLFQQSLPDSSLVRMADYGPFKRKVDDGIALRRAVFSCIESLVADHANAVVSVPNFSAVLESGLLDDPDVQMTTFLIIISLSSSRPDAVLKMLPDLTARFTLVIKEQLRLNKLEASRDSAQEILRAAIKAFHVIGTTVMKGAACADFTDFTMRLDKTPQLLEMKKALLSTNGVISS